MINKITQFLAVLIFLPASSLLAQTTFTKITTGAIVNDGGDSRGNSWGDYDNDGDLDLFVANSLDENNFLYENNGDPEGTGQIIFTRITNGAIVNNGGGSGSSKAGVTMTTMGISIFLSPISRLFPVKATFCIKTSATAPLPESSAAILPVNAKILWGVAGAITTTMAISISLSLISSKKITLYIKTTAIPKERVK
jgi:hypothetical protein